MPRTSVHKIKYVAASFLLILCCLASCTSCGTAGESGPLSPLVSVDPGQPSSPTQTSTDVSATDILPESPVTEDDPTPSDLPEPPEPAKDPETVAPIVDTADVAYSYGDLCEDLLQLSQRYPGIFSYETIGKSVDGRDLFAARIGSPSAPRVIVVAAGMHAREYMAVSLVMGQTEYYLSHYDEALYQGNTYRAVFDACAVVLLPMLNPDGVMLCQEGIGAMQNAASVAAVNGVYRSDYAAGLISNYSLETYLRTSYKANVNGVDLNRNYPAGWEPYHKMMKPSLKNYKGRTAASEPETQAVMAYLSALTGAEALLSVHTQGNVIYWDCGQTGELRSENLELAESVAALTGYNCIDEQNNDASLTDWAVLALGIPALTLEVGVGTKYPLDHTQLPVALAQNLDVWPAVAFDCGIARP